MNGKKNLLRDSPSQAKPIKCGGASAELIDDNQGRFSCSLQKSAQGCPIAAMAIGEVAVRGPTCTDKGVTEVGAPLLFLTTFTFPSSEESQVPIYCRVNKSRAQAVFWTQNLQRQWWAL